MNLQRIGQRLLFRRQSTAAPVLLVGAGPGDPELLTIKARRALEQAQVVIHDRLVSAEILALVPRRARKIYVGKQPGDHAVPQHQIEQITIDAARAGKRVVRLKGGDPFTFGRGGEEMVRLRQAGIAVQVIPGITAAAGCAAQAGIPLTDRHYADSVTFVTAQRRDDAPDTDWQQLARDPGRTLVFYMGLAHAANIGSQLIEHGLPGETPVAFIENGTTEQQREVFSSLQSMGDDAHIHQLRSPCLIIVGRVTELAHKKVGAAAAQKAGSKFLDGQALPLPNLSQLRGHHEQDCTHQSDLHTGSDPFPGHRRRINQ